MKRLRTGTAAHFPLAKACHMAEPKVRGQKDTLNSRGGVGEKLQNHMRKGYREGEKNQDPQTSPPGAMWSVKTLRGWQAAILRDDPLCSSSALCPLVSSRLVNSPCFFLPTWAQVSSSGNSVRTILSSPHLSLQFSPCTKPQPKSPSFSKSTTGHLFSRT